MQQIRPVSEIIPSRMTSEGAGVRLRRAFGDVDPRLDPFLLLDHFGSERPEDYLAGFPWHPHRGMETITYMRSGRVEHSDSLGNKGELTAGDVQWMTAGSGIVHQEMPQRTDRLDGFQLWSNLPRAHKMMAPRYQDIPAADIPEVQLGDGARARVICGVAGGVAGPVQKIITDPQYLDVSLESDAVLTHPVPASHNVFAYVYAGSARFGDPADADPANPDAPAATAEQLVLFEPGDTVATTAGGEGARFLLVAGTPIGEPVAWGGPIVMNSDEELRQAFREYREGTFIKERSGS